ncbi:MAG: acyl-CoA synthetase [Casimicrobiaceae bacterium]
MSAPLRALPGVAAERPEWTTRQERGSVRLIRLMTWLSLVLGRRVSRLLVYGIAAYFFVSSPAAARASRDYLRRALGRPPTALDGYRHILSFASTIHDRVYLLNGRNDLFDIEIHGRDLAVDAIANGRGAFLMGAHMGSFEVIHALGRQTEGVRAAMVMFEENARKIAGMVNAVNPRLRQTIIPLGRIDSMLNVEQALDDGMFVGVLGDRTFTKDVSVYCDFLGDAVALPASPFRMAAVLRRQVIFMAGLYLGGNRYAVHFEPLADFSATPRAERAAAIEAAIHRYAMLLERHCRAAPYNWFNFFDFWAPQTATSPPPRSPARGADA